MLAPNTLKVEEKGRMDNGTFECRHNTNSWWKPCFLLNVQIIETHTPQGNHQFMATWAWMVA